MTRDETQVLTEKYHGQATPAFVRDCHRLASGEPVAYVIGHQPFLGLTLYLDSHPLIPRPETEWWAESLLSSLKSDEPEDRGAVVRLGRAARSATAEGSSGKSPFTFLDLCAGSGAIGCAALKMLRSAEIYFGEIDPVHKATIEKNIHENHLDASRAHIEIGDLFEPFAGTRFDAIAINPPYIPISRVLPKSVADYEPTLALRSGTDGLDLMRRIADELAHHLSPRGVAWIECDSEHADSARGLFEAAGLTSELRTDQYDRPRILVVRLS